MRVTLGPGPPSDERRGELAATLALRTGAEVRFDPGARHAYSTDASNFRQVPVGVVVPRSVDDVVATVETCRELEVPITHRGGGTSLAGQTCNVGVVIDSSKHLRGISGYDPDARTVTVQPGVVLDHLRERIAPDGLTWGPDPSTHDRCTVGGMIGNNSCGVRSLTYGRTDANVRRLDVLLSDGTRLDVGPLSEQELTEWVARPGRVGEIHRELRDLRDRHADEIASGFSPIPRRVSGYDLTALVPGEFDLARGIVGTEGTVASVLGATLRLNPEPAAVAVLVLGFDDVASAGDAVPPLRAAPGIRAIEGLDRHVAAAVRADRCHATTVSRFPDGDAWLLCEFQGESTADAVDAARSAARTLDLDRATVVSEAGRMRAVWSARSAGLGATARVDAQRYWPGWEDAAVAPDDMGPYLRDLGELFDAYGFDPALYGHFGDGCVHARIAFDLRTAGGVATYRRFVEDAADLVVSYGGSLSGEHGDGQQRGELLERMYGPTLVGAMREFKSILDPGGIMNPGKVVDARPLDADLRLRDAGQRWSPETVMAFPEPGGFAGAQERCVGVGACRADVGGGVMCPSYQATRDEEHSPRGRARLLFEMLQPDTDLDGWREDAVHDALELCLACKGCSAECPVGVDIPTYKAEFLHHYHRGRPRPRADLSLGLIHRWARLGSWLPGITNGLLAAPGVGAVLRRAAGVTSRRAPPRFAPRTFRAWFSRHVPPDPAAPPVVLFADTFVDRFEPRIGAAAVNVLERAGYHVEIPDGWACCGRPLYDRGMLGQAGRELDRVIEQLHPAVSAGRTVIVLEPSCLAVFRDELLRLRPDDPRARAVAGACVSLGEFLRREDVTIPTTLSGRAVVHPHCHARASADVDADVDVLAATGLEPRTLDVGCCGLAGSFGFEAGEKFEVSVTVGEHRFAPAIRTTGDDEIIVADGFSCRTQAAHLAPQRPVRHLAEVLAAAPPEPTPEPRFTARDLAAGGGLLAGLVTAGIAWRRRR